MAEAGAGAEKSAVRLLLLWMMATPSRALTIVLAALHLFRRRSKIARLPCDGFELTPPNTISILTTSASGGTPRAGTWQPCLVLPAECANSRVTEIICRIRAGCRRCAMYQVRP